MANNSPLVTIFGGSGFLGRYIARRMAAQGWRVRVAVRRPNEAMFVQTYGDVGQVVPVLANIRDDDSTRAAIQGADAVVNCVGILSQTSRQKFSAVQGEGARRIAKISAQENVSRMVHISSLGADSSSASEYARSKEAGEMAVLTGFNDAVIIRPAIIFGAEDRFFNMFGTMSRYYPVLPMVRPDTKYQPVYVDDVAAAVQNAILGDAKGIYELGGPDVETFRELMQRMLRSVRRKRLLVTLPVWIARINAFFIEMWHKYTLGIVPLVLTRDQIKMMETDNVVSEGAKTLEDLGVHPTSMDAVLDTYLYRFRPQGQFTDLTSSAKNLHG